jgi:hypothetical protein
MALSREHRNRYDLPRWTTPPKRLEERNRNMNRVFVAFQEAWRRLCMATAFLIFLAGCSAGPQTTTTGSHLPTTRVAGYSTQFPLNEDPISEGGHWMVGKTIGLDWGNVSTYPGYAFGHAGPASYADPVALLTGEWPPNQSVEVVVDKRTVFRYPEVEVRLRSSLAKHNCDGYEISFSLRDDDTAYLILVRWNGPLADFTYLLQVGGKQYAVKTGDRIKATIVGNEINAYKNGVLMGTVKDSAYTRGNPGFGFNEGWNGDYGISEFIAKATDGSSF